MNVKLLIVQQNVTNCYRDNSKFKYYWDCTSESTVPLTTSVHWKHLVVRFIKSAGVSGQVSNREHSKPASNSNNYDRKIRGETYGFTVF